MAHPAFENVRKQIGACGIWCGSCAVGNGSLRLATQKYIQVLEGHGIEHWAPQELDYAAMADGLHIVSEMSSCPGCRKGGGRDQCQIRTCVEERGLSDCTECREASCMHSELVDHMRTGALSAGLIVKDSSDTTESFWQRATGRLPSRFPACLLFLSDADDAG